MPKSLPADTWENLFYPPPDYVYFQNSDRFDFEPNATEFSWKNAWWLADAALLAYVKVWKDVEAILKGSGRFQEAKAIGENAPSTRGFLAFRSNPSPFAVVAFRGTDKDDRLNTVTDVKAIPISRDGYIAHKGFVEALDQVWDEISQALAEFLKSHPGAPVYFTGHSLGAALATIAVARFKGGNSVLYTIGSPRVGDDKFVAAVENKARLKFRFVNGGEIVTQVPPDVPLGHYRHVGLEKYIDRHGVIHDGASPLFKLTDLGNGARSHGGAAVLSAIADLPQAISDALGALKSKELVNPPPYIVGNHTPARYAIHIWNHYSKL